MLLKYVLIVTFELAVYRILIFQRSLTLIDVKVSEPASDLSNFASKSNPKQCPKIAKIGTTFKRVVN
jgi:hypothetical protein